MRIGNAAYVQTQHDVMGEMILCLDTITTDPRTADHDPSLMPLIERLVTEAIAASAERAAGLGPRQRWRQDLYEGGQDRDRHAQSAQAGA